MDRGERRHRTLERAKKGLKFWLSFGYRTRFLGEFAKNNPLGCRCRRIQPGCSPKIPASLCHVGLGDYHPCVKERIHGRRLEKAWVGQTGWALSGVN